MRKNPGANVCFLVVTTSTSLSRLIVGTRMTGIGATKSFRRSSANDRQRYAYRRFFTQQPIAAAGAEFFLLPPDLPDMNPIEIAFAKLKTLLRQVHLLDDPLKI